MAGRQPPPPAWPPPLSVSVAVWASVSPQKPVSSSRALSLPAAAACVFVFYSPNFFCTLRLRHARNPTPSLWTLRQFFASGWTPNFSTMRRLVGGEWGGWCCAFDAHSGAVRAIPDKFVSETAVAYGQVPFGFEELQTESFEQIPYLDGSERNSSDMPPGGGSDQLRRRRVQMHPPFACGGDSLPGTAARRLLPTPRSGSLQLRASTASVAEVLAAPAWALDAPVPGRPGVVHNLDQPEPNPNPNPNPNPSPDSNP